MAGTYEETKAKCDVLLASLLTMNYKSLKNEIREACRGVRVTV